MSSGLRRRFIAGIVAAAIVAMLAGAGCARPEKPPAEKPKTLRVAVVADALTFDPHNYKAAPDVTLQAFIFETLVGRDREMRPVAKLAVSWKQLEPKRWEFKLRDGVKFTDGTPLDANAVKVSLERCSKAPRGSGFVGFVESVDIVDRLTVVLNLKYPFGPILNNLSDPVAGIMSPAALQKYGDDIVRNPVGTGPYRLVEWVPNERCVLELNPDYWGKKPQIQRLEFRPIPEESTRLMALKTGEVDVIENPAPHELAGLKKDPNLQVIVTPRARNVWLGFNVQDKVLKDKKLRQAIAYAIDKRAIVDSVLEGLGRVATDGFIPPEVSKTDPPLSYPYDPAKAKQLVDAGYPKGVELNLWTPEARYLRDKQVCEVIQRQLAAVGIKVKITVMEWGSYLAALGRHEQQLYIIGWGFMTGEPAQAMRQTMATGSAFNFTNYSNKAFDDLLLQAEQEPDPARRQKIYQQMSELIMMQDFAVVPLYYMYNCYAASSKVKGFHVTPTELIDVSETTIE